MASPEMLINCGCPLGELRAHVIGNEKKLKTKS